MNAIAPKIIVASFFPASLPKPCLIASLIVDFVFLAMRVVVRNLRLRNNLRCEQPAMKKDNNPYKENNNSENVSARLLSDVF